jgi:hypothetical protein
MRVLNYTLICLTLVAGFSQTVVAQTAPLDEKQKAVLLFDIRLDRLQESELAKSMGIKEMMQKSGASAEIDPSKAVRVFGMVSAPESVQALQQIQAGGTEIPVEFFLKIKFANDGALKEVMHWVKTESHEFTKVGKTYYRPKDEEAPKNLCLGQVDGTSLVLGTDAFVLLPDEKEAFSEGLKSAWDTVAESEDSIRIVVDMVGAKALIDEAIEMGKEGAPPMAVGFMELVPTMNDLRITMDLSGGNLFTLGSTCKDSECATNLNRSLDSIFGWAERAGRAQLDQMKESPGRQGLVAVADEILESLKPNLVGNSVNLTIPKPEGLEAAFNEAVAPQAQFIAYMGVTELTRWLEAMFRVFEQRDRFDGFNPTPNP